VLLADGSVEEVEEGREVLSLPYFPEPLALRHSAYMYLNME